MGYRSEVTIVVPRKSKEDILDIIPKEEWSGLYNSSKDDYGNKIETTLFYLESTKWYKSLSFKGEKVLSGYEQVDKIMDYLTGLDETEGNSNYAFVRIGENGKDIELLGDPYKYGIYIKKSINFK